MRLPLLLAAASAAGTLRTAAGQACPAPAASPAPFTAGSLLALRLGDGAAPLPNSATAVAGFLDEVDPATGAIVQSIALPTGPLVTNATGGIGSVGCAFNGGVTTAGLMSTSLDRRGVALACLPLAPGAAVPTTGSKVVASVGWDASLRMGVASNYLSATGVATAWATANVSGAVSDAHADGAWVYFATSSGPMVAKLGSVGSAQLAGSTTAVQNVLWFPPYLYSVRISSFATLVGTGTAALTPVGVYANSWAPGGVTATVASGGAWMQDNLTLWMADAGPAATTRTLTKYVRANTVPSTVWTVAAGYPLTGISFVDGSGSTVTTTAVRGVAGWFAPDGSPRLALATPLGLVGYNPALTGLGAFTFIRAPCANTRWAGLAPAPVPPPSASPTVTPSATPTPSATGSAGAAPSSSSTATPSPSATSSGTATPTGTPSNTGTLTNTPTMTPSATASVSATATPTASATAFCAPARGAALPFTPGNIVTLRLGDGRAALPTTAVGTPGFLDEWTPAGTLVQTVALPTGPAVADASDATRVASAGCVFNPAVTHAGLMSRSVNGQLLAIACFPLAPGAAIPTTGAKTALGLRWDGTITASVATNYLSSTGVATSWATATIGGAVTDDGSNFVFATSNGPMGVNGGGLFGTGYQAGATSAAQNVLWQPPYLHSVRASSFATLAPAGTATSSLIGGFANSWSATGITTTATTGGAWFESDLVLYLADASTNATTSRMITKFVRNATFPNSPWAIAQGFPIYNASVVVNGVPTVVYGARGLTGSVAADGSVRLYVTTTAGLLSYDTASGAWAHLAAPCGGSNMRFAGVAMAPALPSPTASLTASPSSSPSTTGTGTPSSSQTASPTSTQSGGASPSGSTSVSATPSGTATPTETPTSSLTATASPSTTATVTASATATSSPACAPPRGPASPFTPGNLAVLRLGDGRAALPTTAVGVPAFVDEWTPSGTLVQTIALPTGGVVPDAADATRVASAGCVFNPAVTHAGLMSRSVNGQLLSVACFPLAPGAAIPTTGAKTALGLRWDGTITASVATNYLSSTGVATAWATASVGGAVTDDGSYFYFATSTGPAGVAGGALLGTGFQAGSTLTAQNVLWRPPYLYSVRAATFATLAPAANTTASVIGGFANSWGAPGITTTATTGGAWFESDLVLYLADASTVSTWPQGRMITKFVRNSSLPGSTWAIAPGFPIYNASVVVNGVPTVVYGARGLTGSVAADDSVKLYVTTTAGLLSYDTASGAWAHLAAPCGGSNMRFAGVAMAPALPSPTASITASPTASPSITPSGTPSSSTTASPTSTQSSGATPTSSTSVSATPSGTPTGTASPTASVSATATPSGTATPTASVTPSTSPACAPMRGAAQPFTLGNIVTLRLGDGRAALPTTAVGTPGFLDEWTPSGTLVQTIALPTGGFTPDTTNASRVASAGCVFNPAVTHAGLMSRSVNGQLLAIACFPLAPGAAIPTTGAKTALGLRWDGSITASVATSFASSTGVNTSWATATIGGAVTDDGSNFVFATSGGPIGVNGGSLGPGYQAGATSAAQNVLWQPPYLHSVRASSFATLAPAGTATSSLIGGFANSWSATGITTTATTGGAWFESDLVLYLADASTNATTSRMITKFVRNATFPNSPWAIAPGFPIYNASVVVNGVPTVVYGARALTGSVAADGSVRLYVTTTAGLLSYDTASGAWAHLAAPCGGSNMRFAGVAMAPALPSATRTPSSTPSGSPEPTTSATGSGTPPPTATASSTGSPSGTPTPSRSSSATRTGSRTGTPSASVTPTGSVSATASETASVSATGTGSSSASASGTGTPSSSATGTGTPSSSQTGTGTPSSSQTDTGTGTPSSSQTGTASGTPAPTRSGTPAATGTATKTRAPAAPSGSASRTRSRTATASRTKTRSRTRSPSKKKKLLRQ